MVETNMVVVDDVEAPLVAAAAKAQGVLARLQSEMTTFFGDDAGCIARDENVGKAGDAQVAVHLHAAHGVALRRELLHQRVRLHARRPHGREGVDALAARQSDAVGINGRDGSAEHHLHPEVAKRVQ